MKGDGGPAFPTDSPRVYNSGMTLRDYFAGQALVGFMLSQIVVVLSGHDIDEKTADKDAAEVCYNVADAMLAEREAKES